MVPGWLRTCSDQGTAGSECPWKVEGLVLEFSPALPSRVSTAVGYLYPRWRLVHPEGDFIQLLLLLAGMGKGGDTEHHKGLYGEGKILNLENLTFNCGYSSMYVSSATLQTEILSLEVQTQFLLLTWTLPQLVDVCINASYMKCQLWSIFVEYTSRALYLTDCELMSVECEIPFLKLLLSLAFFLWTVSVPGLLLQTPQASGLLYASVMFQLVFHLKSKSLHLYCNT